ncbi:MAG: tetratricopeptide repeat protein, partial [Candidatus Eremiobacterota bacterium]
MNEIDSCNNKDIKSDNLHLYGLMVELIIEHEGHINEKQRRILDKKIKEWQISDSEAKAIEEEKGKKKKLYKELKDIIDSAGAYIKAKPSPDILHNLNNSSCNLFSTDKHMEALEYIDKILDINPGDLNALTGKAIILFNQGKYDEAMAYYDEILNLDEQNDFIWTNKGDIL